MVKVSIIVPIYNVQEYLGKCLESLIVQTLKDIEIICINDGSTDDSLIILERFAAKDKRIKVIDKQNEGPGVTRNLGIAEAKGEYIGFVDPDDWVKEDMYERLYTQAKQLDSDIVICDYVRYQEWTERVIPQNFFEKAVKYIKAVPVNVPDGKNIDREMLLDTLLVSPCYSVVRIYRREFLINNNIVFSKHKCCEDCPFVLKGHVLAKAVSYVKYAGYIYRLRKNSTVRSYNKRYLDFCEVAGELERFLKEQNLLPRMALNLHYMKVMNFSWNYMGFSGKDRKVLLKHAKNFLTKKEYREMKRYLKIRLKDKIKNIFGKFIQVSKTPRHKVVKIFGLTLKIKRRCGRLGAEQHYINLVRKNYKKYPKDTYLLFDCLHDATAEAIDAYSLFAKMREMNIPAYYVVRKQTTLYQRLEAENKLDHIIVLNFSSRTHPNEFMQKIWEVLLRTKCVLTSFGENSGTADMFFRKHPSWQYVFIQHGSIFTRDSVLCSWYLYPQKFDKFLVCSDREEKLFLKYGFPPEKLLKVGLPRWDLLNGLPKPKEKSILLMLTWRHVNSVIFENSLYRKNLLSLLHNEKLMKYLQQKNITVYFAPHHALKNNMNVDFDLSTEKHIKIVNTQDISQYIRQCSGLLTDFSSVSFDFMFQNKPVVFYILDRHDSSLQQFEREDLAKFDYKQYILPNVYFEEDDVINRVIEYCENDFKIDAATKKIYDSFFYTKENIREQIIQKLEEECPNK